MIENKQFFYLESFIWKDELWVRYYGRDGRWDEKAPIKPYCYIESKVKGHDAVCAKTGRYLKKMEYDFPEDVNDIKADYATWEADVSFERRMMMDMDLSIDGNMRICYLDIETDDSEGVSNPDVSEIISIGMLMDDGREFFLSKKNYSEMEMLSRFFEIVKNVGMIITWNGGEDVWETFSFDMPYMSKRWRNQFEFDQNIRHVALFDLMRHYKKKKQSVGQAVAGGYGLDNVAQQELGVGKVKHDKKISDMTDEELREYNMMDVRLLKEIDDKLGLSKLQISIAQACNLRLTDWRNNKRRSEMTPLKQTDNLFLKECHENGMSWPTMEYRQITDDGHAFTGALVLEPKPGLYNDVHVMDVKSMYPSIIINERYSPDKRRIIIPQMLTGLMDKRKELKQKLKETGETKYDIWQYAYKVVANTAYGAIANQAFRGFNLEIAQAITSKGRNLLTDIKEIVESVGYSVVYGDTDSVFIQIKPDKAKVLEKVINRKIDPYVIEIGGYYPSMLFVGDEKGGRKKRYAGMDEEGHLSIKGLEAIRGDSTILARETQLLMLGKLLCGSSVDECKKCMFNLRKKLREGEYDHWLVMSKGVKKLDEYSKTDKRGVKRKFPPHVRALEQAYELGHTTLYEINYFWTKEDVYPYLDGKIPDNLDYEQYYEKQILAVVEPLFRSLMVQGGGEKYLNRKLVKASRESMSLSSWT